MEDRSVLFSLDRESTSLLKGVAILMVVLGHLDYIYWGGAGGVVLFLLLSGFGLEASCEKKGLDHYWNKRIRRVWLPYVFVGMFAVLALRVQDFPSALHTVIGLNSHWVADKTMWFISYILFWYLMYYLVACICKNIGNRKLEVAVKLCGLFLAALFCRFLCKKGLWHETSFAHLYVLAFPLGVVLCYLGRLRVNDKVRKLFWMAVLFVAAAHLYREYGSPYFDKTSFSMAFLAISLTQLLRLRGKVPGLLCWLGSYSYAIYLWEGLFLKMSEAWFSTMGLELLMDAAVLLVTVLTAVAYWKIYKQLEEMLPLDKWIRI